METTQENQILQKQKRNSIKSCIIESWKVFALNTKDYFKYLWIHLFIAGLGYALFSIISIHFYTDHIAPVMAFIESGHEPSLARTLFAPQITDYLVLATALFAFIFANYLMLGALFSQLRFYKATDSLPIASPFTFWKEIRKDSQKAFQFDLLFFVIIVVNSAFVTLISWLSSWWVMLLLIPVIIYWTVIGTTGRLQHVVENRTFKAAFKNAFKVGHHKFGGYFILLLLTSIPMFIITYIALSPSSIIQFSYCADTLSQLAGDPTGIPPYVLILYIALATIGYVFFSIAYTLQQWPLALYTSAAAKNTRE